MSENHGLMQEDVILGRYLQEAIERMQRAHIVLPKVATTQLYHHLGVAKIREVGAVFINIVNKDYCKSLVIMTPGQFYPIHYHRIKTESFYVLSGVLRVQIDEMDYEIHPGELIHIERGQDHAFSTDIGVVFEEISTTYVPNDSIYQDSKINSAGYAQRRTTISAEQWKEIISNVESQSI